MRYELSLHADDRERYGGPEWFTFNDTLVDDAPADELELIETQLLAHDVSLIQALTELRHNCSVRSVRVMLWLGLHQAGVTVPYKDFTPKVMIAKMRNLDAGDDGEAGAEGGDADPPAQTGEESPSTSSPPSSTDGAQTAPSASS